MKNSLNKKQLYELWPQFKPEYNEEEYFWSNVGGLGAVLLLHCCNCDGPSDPRHKICDKCIEERKKIAVESYKEKNRGEDPSWRTIVLCRIYAED